MNDRDIGVGPWIGPLPEGAHWDLDLLREGDRRNVADQFRYWRNDAIRTYLAERHHPLMIGVENWTRDPNIGSVVRTANAFNVASVWIIGERRWNRRGAMVTDRYIRVDRVPSVAELLSSSETDGYTIVGVDNVQGSVPIESYSLPRKCLMLFGSEGPGLSDEAQRSCSALLHISQYGSTRSVNAGAAAAIAMYEWVRQQAQ